jgi:hypothetical protein
LPAPPIIADAGPVGELKESEARPEAAAGADMSEAEEKQLVKAASSKFKDGWIAKFKRKKVGNVISAGRKDKQWSAIVKFCKEHSS